MINYFQFSSLLSDSFSSSVESSMSRYSLAKLPVLLDEAFLALDFRRELPPGAGFDPRPPPLLLAVLELLDFSAVFEAVDFSLALDTAFSLDLEDFSLVFDTVLSLDLDVFDVDFLPPEGVDAAVDFLAVVLLLLLAELLDGFLPACFFILSAFLRASLLIFTSVSLSSLSDEAADDSSSESSLSVSGSLGCIFFREVVDLSSAMAFLAACLTFVKEKIHVIKLQF